MTPLSRPLACVPPLLSEEIEDAEFRAKALAWSQIVGTLDVRAAAGEDVVVHMARIIGRSEREVGRWIADPARMTISRLGLLAESLNADLSITFRPRRP